MKNQNHDFSLCRPTAFFLLAGLLFAAVMAPAAKAQLVYGRSLVVPERPIYESFAPEPDYNLRLGPVDFNVGFGVAVDWNDNVNLAPSDSAESDFILRPYGQVDAVWRLTDLNTLKFSLGLGYEKYFDNSDLDTNGLLISPTSAIALRLFVGDFRITVSDSFSYQQNSYSLPTISNTAIYERFENQAGIQLDWLATSTLTATVGYTHYNLWTFGSDEFDTLEQATDTVFVRPSIEITPTVAVGLSGSASWTEFTASNRGDAQMYLGGAFVDVQLTEYTRARVEAGVQFADFSRALPGDSDSTTAPYGRAEISNKLNEAFTQRLGLSYFTEIGYESNYYTNFRIDYALDWNLIRNVTLRPAAFYENYESSSALGDSGNRYGFALGLGYQLTPSITLGVGYRFILKNSDLPDNDYRQNVVTLSLSYQF